MSKLASKDVPLQEVTLRKYESPSTDDKRELTKKFLLSVGLLQPGESRDIIVDIFLQLLQARKEKVLISIPQLIEKLPAKGKSAPNVRRQLRRLRELKLVEKQADNYRITEFGSLHPIINDYIIQFLVNPSIDRVKEYAKKLDEF